MINNYQNLTIATVALSMCPHLFLLATTALLLTFCSKKKAKSSSSSSKEPTSDADQRPPGGGNEMTSTHFTPPHISTAEPGPSLLRQKRRACPVHFQFSDSDEDDGTFVDSANTSDIEFDSTQSPTSDLSFLHRCTCFCGQKRVRFQCPPSFSSKSFSFGFH